MLDSEDVFRRLSFLAERFYLSPSHDSLHNVRLDITEWMMLAKP
jgi:hypothetical protein